MICGDLIVIFLHSDIDDDHLAKYCHRRLYFFAAQIMYEVCVHQQFYYNNLKFHSNFDTPSSHFSSSNKWLSGVLTVQPIVEFRESMKHMFSQIFL